MIRRWIATGALITGLVLLATVAPQAAIAFVPVALLVVALIHGRFPGERLIERLAGRGRRKPRRSRAVAVRRPALPLLVRPAGHRLAADLAMRPPPAWRLAHAP